MINLLTTIGRFTMILGSILAVIIGYAVGKMMMHGGPDAEIGGIVGGLLGLIVAGTVFGVAAAIYDSQTSLRALLAIARENAKQNVRIV